MNLFNYLTAIYFFKSKCTALGRDDENDCAQCLWCAVSFKTYETPQ